MTVIYVPRLIESAEQAEALPVGTYAKSEETAGTGTWYAPPRVNIGRGMWSGDDLYRCSDMVGWTALVPIEAEEVIGAELRYQITDKSYEVHVMRSTDMDNARWQVEHNPKSATGRIMRQYRTPWEEA